MTSTITWQYLRKLPVLGSASSVAYTKCGAAHLCAGRASDSAAHDRRRGKILCLITHRVTMRTQLFSAPNSQGSTVIKPVCLPFITVKWQIEANETGRAGGRGAWVRSNHSDATAAGRQREVFTKNKTFPLITSVTSRLYPGIIFIVFDDAVYTFKWTLNQFSGIYIIIQHKTALLSTKTL